MSLTIRHRQDIIIAAVRERRLTMADTQEVKTAAQIIEEEKSRPKGPDLPEDFYMSLLNLPACKSMGYCDDCGRCER